MIKNIKYVSNSEWDEFLEKNIDTTYSQTREWYEIWSEYSRLNIKTILIKLNNDKEILFPLAYKNSFKGLIRNYYSSPNGVGGFITNSELDSKEKIALYGFLSKFTSLILISSPFNDIFDGFIGWTKNDFVQVINLKLGFEFIFKNWRKGHICDVKKALKSNLSIVEAKNIEEWQEYFDVYQDSIERWGDKLSSSYTWDLFDIIYRKKSDKIKLWVAKYQGKIISGALCFYHNKHICYWHGAGLKEYFHLQGGHLLQYFIIKDACQKGFYWYDFNSSGGHENVIKFKNGFFTEKKTIHILIKDDPTILKKIWGFAKYIRS